VATLIYKEYGRRNGKHKMGKARSEFPKKDGAGARRKKGWGPAREKWHL